MFLTVQAGVAAIATVLYLGGAFVLLGGYQLVENIFRLGGPKSKCISEGSLQSVGDRKKSSGLPVDAVCTRACRQPLSKRTTTFGWRAMGNQDGGESCRTSGTLFSTVRCGQIGHYKMTLGDPIGTVYLN